MEQAELETLVSELEGRVERLRALYDQYFTGIERLEPLIPKKEVERRLAVLRKQQIKNTGLRFRFNQIVARYNTFLTYWVRTARQIEEGRYRRDVVRAARRFGIDPTRQGMDSSIPPPPPTQPPLSKMPDRPSVELLALDPDPAPFELEELTSPIEEADPFPKPREVPAPAASSLRIAPRLSAAPPAADSAPRDRGIGAPPPPPSGPVAASPPRPALRPMNRPSIPDGVAPPPPAPASSMRPPLVRPGPTAMPPPLPAAARSAAAARPPAPTAAPPLAPTAAPPPAPTAAPPRATPTLARPSTLPSAGVIVPRAASSTIAPRPAGPVGDLTDDRFRQIYADYVETRRRQNEPTSAITRDALAKHLTESTARLKQKHGEKAVDFEVVVKDGKTILRPVVK